MTTNTNTGVLSPADAIALGDLLTGLQGNRKIEWLSESGDIMKGELRSLVTGPNNFSMLAWGTDIRDAYVWITANGFEHTESVKRLVMLLQEGGCIINGDHQDMVRIEGRELDMVRNLLCTKARGTAPYLLRIQKCGDAMKFKVNGGEWTYAIGQNQPPY